MKQIHIVPLSRQPLTIFHELHEKSGDGRFVFPGNRAETTAPYTGEARCASYIKLAVPPANIPFTVSGQWRHRKNRLKYSNHGKGYGLERGIQGTDEGRRL